MMQNLHIFVFSTNKAKDLENSRKVERIGLTWRFSLIYMPFQ